MIGLVVALPALAGLVCFLLPWERARRALLVATALAHSAVVVLLGGSGVGERPEAWLSLDGPGFLFLAITSFLFLCASFYCLGYLHREERADRPDMEEGFLFRNSPEQIFIGALLLFLAAMSLVTVSRHLGLFWVALEATTLTSAPLIYFHRHHRSLEAMWKYLLVCSVGIAIALLGTFFLAASAAPLGAGENSLLLSRLLTWAPFLDSFWLKLGFIFLLVGYGTKMGLAPLHTWLPDAHSEAPSVVSALLSGAAFELRFFGCPARFSNLQRGWFEREVAEQFGIEPEGHPWPKPLRFHPPLFKIKGDRAERAPVPEIGAADFFQMKGEEIHEVAVGPVHAGVIEPGHFRFQCHGERVIHLEISLGYQHRGIERGALGGPHKETLFQMETAAGDTSVGHATAYSQLIESLSDRTVSARAHALRGVGLELERLANHTGDLGALCNDVGYLPVASFCGRIREDLLNITALACGSRLGRSWVRPGGVGFDLETSRIAEVLNRLKQAERDIAGAVELIWREPSVLSRLENPGVLSKTEAEELGVVGPATRASGLVRDVRRDFPWGIYRFTQIPVVPATSGDVLARALIRWREIQHSLKFVREQLQALPEGEILTKESPLLKPNQLAVSLTEGWRGEICHAAITDAKGKFSRYKIVNPSFHNWMGLAVALRGEQISDFPLCNKSFNLSYAGTDL